MSDNSVEVKFGGDASGAAAAAGSAIAKVPKEISAAWQQANKEVSASASELDKKIGNLWGSGTPTEAKKGGDKSYTSKEANDKQIAERLALNNAILDGERALITGTGWVMSW